MAEKEIHHLTVHTLELSSRDAELRHNRQTQQLTNVTIFRAAVMATSLRGLAATQSGDWWEGACPT